MENYYKYNNNSLKKSLILLPMMTFATGQSLKYRDIITFNNNFFNDSLAVNESLLVNESFHIFYNEFQEIIIYNINITLGNFNESLNNNYNNHINYTNIYFNNYQLYKNFIIDNYFFKNIKNKRFLESLTIKPVIFHRYNPYKKFLNIIFYYLLAINILRILPETFSFFKFYYLYKKWQFPSFFKKIYYLMVYDSSIIHWIVLINIMFNKGNFNKPLSFFYDVNKNFLSFLIIESITFSLKILLDINKKPYGSFQWIQLIGQLIGVLIISNG